MDIKIPLNPEEFEKAWVHIAEEIIKELMADPQIEAIKSKVRHSGHVELDDRNQFIEIVNRIKYEVIFKHFGEEGSESYEQFRKMWQQWQSMKGTARPQGENVFEENINHLLFGSTPDPDYFLRDFDLYKDTK